MKKLQQIFLFLLLSFTATACFEIREEITVNKNGGGTYGLMLDMAQSRSFLDMMKASSEEKGKEPFAQMDSSFSRVSGRFDSIPGISNTRSVNNKQDYVFGLQFDFKDIKALNAALANLNKDKNPEGDSYPDIYEFSKGTLKRTNNFYLKNVSESLSKKSSETGDQSMDQVLALFGSATYAYVVKTEGKIKKYSNKQSEISSDKKELRYSTTLSDVLSGKADPSNTIKIR